LWNGNKFIQVFFVIVDNTENKHMKGFYIYILFCFIIFINSCIPKAKVAPVLPTSESSAFDFSYFYENNKEDNNFSFASEKVLGWRGFLEDTISIQKEIIKNTEQYSFAYQKDNTWLSAFSFNLNDVNYSAKFFGITDVDTVLYKGFVSYDTISDLMLLDGKVNSNAKVGSWVFNEGVVVDYEYKSVKILSINWNFLENKHIKFTINQAGSKNLDYFYYVDSVDTEYNAYIDVYSKGNENHTIVQWNKATKQGRVKDMLRFDNENWHYWDSNLQDISKGY